MKPISSFGEGSVTQMKAPLHVDESAVIVSTVDAVQNVLNGIKVTLQKDVADCV